MLETTTRAMTVLDRLIEINDVVNDENLENAIEAIKCGNVMDAAVWLSGENDKGHRHALGCVKENSICSTLFEQYQPELQKLANELE